MEGNSRYGMLFPRGSRLCIAQTWSGRHVPCCRVVTVSLVLEWGEMKYALEFHLEVTETYHRSPREPGTVKSDLQVGDTTNCHIGSAYIEFNRVSIHLSPSRLPFQR